LNHRADYFPSNCDEPSNVTAKLLHEIVIVFFEIQTPHFRLTVKPFVHMTIL